MDRAGSHTGRRRSRRRRQRRRNRAIFAAGASLTLALASVVTVASLSGVDVASAAVDKARSFADLMSARSPGERKEAHLIKTKRKHARMLAERESNIPLPPPLNKAALTDFAPGPPTFEAAFVPPEMPLLAEAAPLLPGIFGPVVGGVFSPGGGGVPGGGGPPEQPPPPPPVVPEPSTWAMMVLGLGLTGIALRRRRAATREFAEH